MLHHRKFKDYETYKEAQSAKASYAKERLLSSVDKRTEGFRKLFVGASKKLVAGSILCLGARTGCEVFGARKAGFKESIGVDLCPLKDIVIEADWADLPFEENSFANVFTNSIDHALDLEKMITEIKRVLKPGGIFFLLIAVRHGKNGGPHTLDNWLDAGGNEALWWKDTSDVADAFVSKGFKLESSVLNRGKWHQFFLRNIK